MTEPHDPFAVPEQPSGQTPPAQPGGYPPPPPPLPSSDYGQPAYGPPGYGQPYGQASKTNTLAIVALVAAFFCAPAGIIMGFIARGQITQRGERGAGLALGAIIVGFALLLLNIVLFATGSFHTGGTTSRGY